MTGDAPLKADDELPGAAATCRLLAGLLSLPEVRLKETEKMQAAQGSAGDPQQRLKDLAVAADLNLNHPADVAVSHLENTDRQRRRAISGGFASSLDSRRTPLKWLGSASTPTRHQEWDSNSIAHAQ